MHLTNASDKSRSGIVIIHNRLWRLKQSHYFQNYYHSLKTPSLYALIQFRICIGTAQMSCSLYNDQFLWCFAQHIVLEWIVRVHISILLSMKGRSLVFLFIASWYLHLSYEILPQNGTDSSFPSKARNIMQWTSCQPYPASVFHRLKTTVCVISLSPLTEACIRMPSVQRLLP